MVERAISVLPKMKAYVEHYVELNRKPNVASFSVLEDAFSDQFLSAKLEFFKLIAQKLEPFLQKYQTDVPMIPFVYADLIALLRRLMKLVVKKQLYDGATSANKILSISLAPQSTDLLSSKDISLGIATEAVLQKSSASQLAVKDFKESCKKFVVCTLLKIAEKSPLRHELVRAVSSLSPIEISNSTSIAYKRFEACVRILYQCNRITSGTADLALEQYTALVDSATNRSAFTSFDVKSDRVDEFWYKLLADKDVVALKSCIKVR